MCFTSSAIFQKPAINQAEGKRGKLHSWRFLWFSSSGVPPLLLWRAAEPHRRVTCTRLLLDGNSGCEVCVHLSPASRFQWSPFSFVDILSRGNQTHDEQLAKRRRDSSRYLAEFAQNKSWVVFSKCCDGSDHRHSWGLNTDSLVTETSGSCNHCWNKTASELNVPKGKETSLASKFNLKSVLFWGVAWVKGLYLFQICDLQLPSDRTSWFLIKSFWVSQC